jgi:4-amino-4-deoxychorismate lyase
MRAVMLDGLVPADTLHAVAVADRGLNYGDGLFESMLLRDGRVRLLDAHLDRLALGCTRLNIPYPGARLLQSEIAAVVRSHRDGVVKVVVTRGCSGRGYRPSADPVPTRIIALYDAPADSSSEIAVRWCEMRMSRNPALAGIKHLNRLEQVLAQQEWSDSQIGEGLMLDYEGELVSGTSTNVFLVRGAELMTPDLRYCGVRGIMRGAVIETAKQLEIPLYEEPLWPDDLDTATEVFVTNAVRGVRSVITLGERSWPRGNVTQVICHALEAHA